MENVGRKKSDIEIIMLDAINYWSVTLNIQVIFSVLYISMVFLLGFYFLKYFGLYEELLRLTLLSSTNRELAQTGINEWVQTPSFANFVVTTVLIRALMFPLNIGLFHIYKKIDDNEYYDISDLFEGFRGLNFLKFLGFGIFWGFINLYARVSPLLVIVWILLTIFSAPLMLFKNKSIFESIRLNFKVIKSNFVPVIVCCLLAFILSYLGLMFFLIGIIFTLPFWNAVIYSMYKKYFDETLEKIAD